MEEVLLRQLVRQLKIVNFWITLFGTLFLVTLIILGVLIFKMLAFVHSTEQKLSDIQTKTSQALDVQKQVCSTSALSKLLDKTSDFCK